jgi:hypothetical protein
MILDYLKNKSAARLADKKEMASVVLFGVSVFLGILILIKATSFFVAPARAENIAKEAVSQSKPNAKDMEKHFAAAVAIADGLKKNNLFVPPVPKQHPVTDVFGIMGNEALINGNWYKAGDRIGDARIVAIEPSQVRIEWEGSEKVFTPISSGGLAGTGTPGRGGPEVREKGPGGASAPLVSIPAGGGPGRGFGGLSPEEGARMREGFESMRARFENMSEEERQAFRERMRGRFGGGEGGGGNSGGGDNSGGGRREGRGRGQ